LEKRYGENGWEDGAGWRLMMLSVRDDGVSDGGVRGAVFARTVRGIECAIVMFFITRKYLTKKKAR
jgi:hypothetical protein